MRPPPIADFQLPAVVDVGSASELLARLAQALSAGPIILDGSKLQRLDTAGVQLLCVVARAAERCGTPLIWRTVSPMLVSYAGLLGVGGLLRFDGVRQEGLEWFE